MLLLWRRGCRLSATSTVVEVDVLAEPEVQPEKPVDVIVIEDLHLHRHLHFHEEPISEPVQVEVKRVGSDSECERLAKEHEARVRKWKREMGLP